MLVLSFIYVVMVMGSVVLCPHHGFEIHVCIFSVSTLVSNERGNPYGIFPFLACMCICWKMLIFLCLRCSHALELVSIFD